MCGKLHRGFESLPLRLAFGGKEGREALNPSRRPWFSDPNGVVTRRFDLKEPEKLFRLKSRSVGICSDGVFPHPVLSDRSASRFDPTDRFSIRRLTFLDHPGVKPVRHRAECALRPEEPLPYGRGGKEPRRG